METNTVTAGNGSETPGTMIRRAREARGMSLRELAAATRIPRTSLAHIEDDAFDELPAEVFVRGFLRNAARELRLDNMEVIEAYERHTGRVHTSALSVIERREREAARPLGATQLVEATPRTVTRTASRFRVPSFDGIVEYVGSARPAYVIGTLVVLLGIALAVSVVTSDLDRAPTLSLSNAPPAKASWNVKADGTKARWILDGQSNVHNGAVGVELETDTKTAKGKSE